MILRPLTSEGAYAIEHWFDDPEVNNRLGGRPWIHRALHLLDEPAGDVYRGRVVLRSHAWLALDDDGTPVAFIGGEVYDRYVRYHGEGKPLTDEDRRTSIGLAYAVDPTRWGQGHGRAALAAVLAHPEVADVEVFFCGIDPDNHASRRCAAAAGFELVDPNPDFEDMLYYRRTS